MNKSTLLVVHGTGVRSASFEETLDQIRLKVSEFDLPCIVEPCLWGDVLGIDFAGLSLPVPPTRSPDDEALALRWEYLQVDPLFDLQLWSAPASQPARTVLGRTSAGQRSWESISNYGNEYEKKAGLVTLLERNRILGLFKPAWDKIVQTGLPEKAFAAVDNDSDAAAVARVLAEALAAQMMHDGAVASPAVAVPAPLAKRVVAVMLFDWNQERKGLKVLVHKFFGSATRTVVRPLRAGASRAVAPAIGDILNYQAVGQALLELIGKKVGLIQNDVFLLSHSLGGIACFELMVAACTHQTGSLDNVKGLITAGSQAPLLYELDALKLLRKGAPLPDNFPRWLNLYDENDLLSYCADRLFPGQHDKLVDSMLPPAEAHSAYWKLDETWAAIKTFVS